MPRENNVYPLRGATEQRVPRQDPVYYGRRDDSGPLNRRQLADYENQGYLVFPDAFSAEEISRLKKAMRRLEKEHDERREGGKFAEAAGKTLADVHRRDEIFSMFARDPRIADSVGAILGGPTYLHRSEINIADTKNGNSWPWHSQFERWHVENGFPRMRCMEAWIMLTDGTPYNGPMRVLQKSHRTYVVCKRTSPESLSRPSLETLDWLLAEGRVVNLYGHAGTLILSDSNLICGSTASAVPIPRVLLTYSYNSMDNLPIGASSRALDQRSPAPLSASAHPDLPVHAARRGRARAAAASAPSTRG